MNKLILLAGAALMIGSAPAVAKPDGKGGAKAHVSKGAKAQVKGNKGVKVRQSTAARVRVDRNRNGIADWDEAMARRYGGALCPPGLAKKAPACIPPGQAKRMFREGQRLPMNYRYYTDYNDIPLVLRDQYNLDDDYRYIYRNNIIYVVDPRTSLITRIIDAIL